MGITRLRLTRERIENRLYIPLSCKSYRSKLVWQNLAILGLTKKAMQSSIKFVLGQGLSSFVVERKSDYFILKQTLKENGLKETSVTFKWLRDHCRYHFILLKTIHYTYCWNFYETSIINRTTQTSKDLSQIQYLTQNILQN